MRTSASFFAISLLVAACGGKVVVDPDAPGDPSMPSDTPSCVDVCNKVGAACGTTSSTSCTQSCAKLDVLFEGACPEPYHAWLACTDADPGAGCQGNGVGCETEVTAFTECLAQVCGANPTACM